MKVRLLTLEDFCSIRDEMTFAMEQEFDDDAPVVMVLCWCPSCDGVVLVPQL